MKLQTKTLNFLLKLLKDGMFGLTQFLKFPRETLMSGGLKDIEHYKYLQGELSALYYIANAISDMGKDI